MFTLGRKIDLHYPTNRWISIIAILATGSSFFITGSLSLAWRTGAGIFLAWALTRELDPKREYAAFVSAFLAASSLFVAFEVDLMEIAFLLLMLRFVSEITGDGNTLLDMAALFGLAALLGYNKETSVYPLLLLIGTSLNVKNIRNNKMSRVFILLTAALFTGYLLFLEGPGMPQPSFPRGWTIYLYLGTVASYLGFVIIDTDKSTFDDKGQPVEGNKILKAQLYFALATSLLFFFTKLPIGNVIVYLSSMLGYLFYGIIVGFVFPLLSNR